MKQQATSSPQGVTQFSPSAFVLDLVRQHPEASRDEIAVLLAEAAPRQIVETIAAEWLRLNWSRLLGTTPTKIDPAARRKTLDEEVDDEVADLISTNTLALFDILIDGKAFGDYTGGPDGDGAKLTGALHAVAVAAEPGKPIRDGITNRKAAAIFKAGKP